MVSGLINANPIVYEKKERRARTEPGDVDEYAVEAIDQLEIFDHLRDIKDPEHPYSLEELKVITEDAIEVDDKHNCVRVTFTPTVEHCSMATVIGLCLRVKLMRSLPLHYKYLPVASALFIGGLTATSVTLNQVDLPQWFSSMSIALESDVDLEAAHEKSQKYKEGKFILERFKILGPDGSHYMDQEAQIGGSDPDDA